MKYREEKEAIAAKNIPMETDSATGKGKGPMEEIPQAFVDQQVKGYLHTSEQIKQKLSMMALALDTQEIITSQPAETTQVSTIVEKAQSEQTHIEEKPFKNLKVQV